MNVSPLSSQEVNDAANLCQDPETKGFDLQAGQSWVYPTNYPVRDYQFNIIQEALHKNTLVSLPTGLGKTFIAAVVMYNFYRWYPHDKIIFMAPTRPLVKQQMDACYNITAIPQEVTSELTGTKVQQSRTEIWQSKRVFFITPQVLQNDLPIIVELGGKIKCLVFDEAHKAKGNHAYCEVIRKLLQKNKLFRVLALSATPGNSAKDVLEVMQNLLISHVEFRSEDSEDVKPYVFERTLETVVVPLGEKLQQVKDEYIQILEKYTRTLIKYKVIYGNCSNLTKGKIFMVMKEFQAKNSGSRTPNYAEIMKSLNICLTLYHAYETLIRCGLRAFQNFYEEHIKNPLLSGNMGLRQILEDLREYLGPSADVQSLPDGTFTEVPATTKFGHPKLYKLRDILLTHFRNCDDSTRIIVFFEYRESVSEAFALLSQSHPLVRPRIFVGQGSGVTQKDQINTIKAFRDGNCNTLLSTCIGEEGLDVGDVDLIVCFDIANKSPIRMIQRMGRTGRKKEGRIVVLVTEGREQQTLKECLIYKNNLGNFVSNPLQLEQGKYNENPKMIPSYIEPKCQKMHITVKRVETKKNGNLKSMLKKMCSDAPKFTADFQIIEIKERLKSRVENLWDKEQPLESNFEESKINFRKHLEKQRSFQACGAVKHSKQTEMFVSLLQFADSKRFNLPITQNNSKFGVPERILKQGDIRSMFSKPILSTLSQATQLSSQHHIFTQKDRTESYPAEFFDEISIFLTLNMPMKRTCKTCDLLFECPKMMLPRNSEKIDLNSFVIPDLSIFDDITAKDLEDFANSLNPKPKDLLDDGEVFDDITFNENLDDTVSAKNKSTTYETPRNFDKILKSFRICEDEEDETSSKIVEKPFGFETPKGFAKVLNSICNSPMEEFKNEEMISKKSQSTTATTHAIAEVSTEYNTSKNVNVTSHQELLAFFKLSSLDDIFLVEPQHPADLDATIIYTPELTNHKSPGTITPDLFEESPDLFSSPGEDNIIPTNSESPILCSFETVQSLQVKKKLFNDSSDEQLRAKPRLSNLKVQRRSFFESTRSKSTDSKASPDRPPTILDISDICDLSSFLNTEEELEDGKNVEISKKEEKDVAKLDQKEKYDVKVATKNEKDGKVSRKDDLDISALCDLSVFGITTSSNEQGNEEKNAKKSSLEKENDHKHKKQTKRTSPSKVVKSPVKELTIDDICDMASFFDEPFVDEKNKKTNFSDLDDFCDLSFFMDTPKKETASSSAKNVQPVTQKPNEKLITQIHANNTATTSVKEKDLTTTVIDLTDSDLEASPTNKTLSQLSITQMLSLVAKTEEPRNSQKENTFTPIARTQQPKRSRSSKKRILQLKQNMDSPKTSKIVNPRTSQKTTTPTTKKSKFNISVTTDSDDDFEDPFQSPVFAKPKTVFNQVKKNKPEKEVKRRKKLLCEFFDQEAEVSRDNIVVSDDEDSGEDCFEASFVADETQDFLNTTTTQARYMQSVKSPVRRGVFKIPETFRHNITNVFSQEVSNEDNTYLNDSFCVEDDEAVETDNHDVSELELLEKRLKKMKKSKKRKKSDDNVNTKRRRIIVLSDDSD